MCSRDHAAIDVRRLALVVFDGPGRRVRRVIATFADTMAAELFAVEQGWPDFAVAPASLVLPLDGLAGPTFPSDDPPPVVGAG